MNIRIATIILCLSCPHLAAQDNPIISDEAANSKLEVPDAGKTTHNQPTELEPEFRPLGVISVLNAVSLHPGLRQPDDHARQYVQKFGIIADVSGYRPTPVPATNVHLPWYQPLYFEDPNLERCGQHHGCFTDAISAAWFLGRIPVLPYMKGQTSPHACVQSLGECGPCQKFGVDAYLPPPDLKGAAFQAVATIGFVFLIP